VVGASVSQPNQRALAFFFMEQEQVHATGQVRE
jgi:hypothetical protein